MSIRKPLVINPSTGLPEELPAGDSVPGASQVTMFSAVNGEDGTIARTKVVYVSAAGEVQLARADASGTAAAVGCVADATIATEASGQIQTDGVLDGFSGLTPNSTYFLDPTTAGAITDTAPTTSGHHVVKIGRALSTTELLIDIDYIAKRA